MGENRRLTELGEAAHEGLDGAMRQLTVEVRCDRDPGTRELDAALLDARLADPAAPPPQDANPGLRRLWSLPWQEVTLISTQRGSAVQRIVMTTEAGAFGVERDGSSGSATLTPLPSATYLSLLLRFGGFDI